MRAIHPRDVVEQHARLAPAFAALSLEHSGDPATERRRGDLLRDWQNHVTAPVGWLDAPRAYAFGRDLKERVERLRAETRDPWGVWAADQGAAFATGYGPTWPHMVLDYRKLWDPYVMGTARAAIACSKGAPLPASNLTQELYTGELTGIADSITADWNAHAGATDREIMTQAGDFLQDYQRVVRRVSDVYQPQIRASCPTAMLPQPPIPHLQVPVIGAIEDAEILAHGTLQVLAIGATGALEALEGTGEFIGRQVDKATGELLVIAIAVAVAVVGVAVVMGKR